MALLSRSGSQFLKYQIERLYMKKNIYKTFDLNIIKKYIDATKRNFSILTTVYKKTKVIILLFSDCGSIQIIDIKFAQNESLVWTKFPLNLKTQKFCVLNTSYRPYAGF